MFDILNKEVFYYTYKFFNIEEFDKEGLDFTNPDYEEFEYALAQIEFRISPIQVIHERAFETVYDWLGSVGGFLEIIMALVTILVGGFLTFSQTFRLIYKMYEGEDEEEIDLKTAEKINPGFCKRVWLKFCCCFMGKSNKS